MVELLVALKNINWHYKLFISITAGIFVAYLCEMTVALFNLIRVMPNTFPLVRKN
ncbi:hypothetical protein BTN50_0892 [Candidatus Enterovibrio altilux]|uniref:Uncharacterized protein n=1 Tax=Candidatus Enterovibrio altilux TaxID=1927128 RepID=A0A291B8Q8_9GAMM|nr:hypothetical protein BTN50_0892 [Candidatus Enterovibrio luxaltus]